MCIDDYSRFSRTNFFRDKSKAFGVFEELWLKLAKEHNHGLLKITRIRSDNGKEFENFLFRRFYSKNDIEHEFLALTTPHQNGVVERKNITL